MLGRLGLLERGASCRVKPIGDVEWETGGLIQRKRAITRQAQTTVSSAMLLPTLLPQEQLPVS